jgi:hypothetical protein
VDGDEIYSKEIADVMEAELLALVHDDGIKSVAGSIPIRRITRDAQALAV